MTTNQLSVFLLSFGLLPFTFLNAQQAPETMSLNDAVAIALKNNRDIQVAELDEKIARARYQQTSAIFLPQAAISYSALTTNNPLNAFGFKLQQRTITQNDFNPDQLNHPSATSDFSAKLEVQQPLINPDLIWQRKAAKNEAELYEYKKIRTREYLEFQVKNAYHQLQLAAEAGDVLEEALNTARAIHTFTGNRLKQGLLQKSDLLNVQVTVSAIESDLASAKSGIRNASDLLSLLLNKPLGIVYRTEKLQQNAPIASKDESLQVPSGRADLLAMQKAIEASGNGIKSTRLSWLPKLNAFGNYQLNDQTFAGSGATSWLAGIQLSWNIFSGNKTRNLVNQQKLERDKLVVQFDAQKEQAQMELDKTYRDLSDSMFKTEQAKAAVEHAAEALRILKNRYEQGLANTTDVLAAQTQLSQQKLSLVQATFLSNIAAERLHFLTSSANK